MEMPRSLSVGHPDRNGASTLHINDAISDRIFLSSMPVGDPTAFFALSLATPTTVDGVGVTALEGRHHHHREEKETDEGEDQSVSALFCMMVQMQTIMKGIQENVSKLDARVTLIETESEVSRKNSTDEETAVESKMVKERHVDVRGEVSSNRDRELVAAQSPRPRMSTTTTSTILPIVVPSQSNFHLLDNSGNGNHNPTTTEMKFETNGISGRERKDGIFIETHPRVSLFEEFQKPLVEMPIQIPYQSTESQIPFISRRTLWKKANKPKWKRRSDLVPRLKEIVNEKFRSDDNRSQRNHDPQRGTTSIDFTDASREFTPLNGHEKTSYKSSGTNHAPSKDPCLNLTSSNVLTNKTVFPNHTPSCLAPIWRSSEVSCEASFVKPSSAGESINAAFAAAGKTGADGTFEDRTIDGETAPSDTSTKPEFMCGICFKVLGSKSSLDTHTRSIHENRKFPCNDCGKRFFDRSTLRRHKKCIHENITHRCKFCSLEFSRRHYLTSHVHKEHPGSIESESTGVKAKASPPTVAVVSGPSYYEPIRETKT